MLENTLTVGRISEGFVLDHIEAGKSMEIYKYLHLDKLDCCVAIIKNAKSNKMGKKDIMKIECPIDFMDLDILGFIDHNITVNIIENGEIISKKPLTLPKKIKNVIRCKNPRCITSIEQGLDHVFVLTDEENQVYRCQYCEEALKTSGDAFFPVILGAIFMYLFAVGGTYFLGIHMGLLAVGSYIAMAGDECARAVGMVLRWKSGKMEE